MSKRVWALLAVSLLVLLSPVGAWAGPVNFTTFVTGGSIAAAEGGNHSTIAFNYAGNKFVGSVYFDNQLFQTDLNGGSVTPFGNPLPVSSASVGEVVVGASLGQAGFAQGDIFAGSGAGPQIYHYANSGGSPTLFATLPNNPSGGGPGVVRQIFFDPGSSFGGNMVVTTNTGNIYTVNSAGVATWIASIGADTEGMDIIQNPTWGPYNGDLMVASEGLGTVKLVTPGGAVINTGLSISLAETVSFVPLNLGSSGNPVEGFYVANYPVDIQKSNASDFAGLQGDVIVTSEFGSSSPVYDISYNGSTFAMNQVGTLPNQSEDGIFVTAQRVGLVGTPEPSSMLLLAGGLCGLWTRLKLRKT